MLDIVRHRPFVSFAALAYVGSWLFWSPAWLGRNGLGVLPIELTFGQVALVNQLGLFAGPFAAALLVTRACEGSVRPLWRRMVRVRVRPFAYVIALLLVPLAVLGAAAAFGAVPASGSDVGRTVVTVLVTYVVFILGGPLQEEPGWRGVALPRLQERWHPAAAAVLLGVVWTFWHAPLFLVREWDTPRGSVGDLVAYLLFVVALSVVMSWLTNVADGSVALAILGHNSVNWTLVALVPALTGGAPSSMWPGALGVGVLAVLALVATRGRLGRPGQEPTRGASRIS